MTLRPFARDQPGEAMTRHVSELRKCPYADIRRLLFTNRRLSVGAPDLLSNRIRRPSSNGARLESPAHLSDGAECRLDDVLEAKNQLEMRVRCVLGRGVGLQIGRASCRERVCLPV